MNKWLSTLLASACLVPLLGERAALADTENDPIVNVAPSGGTFFDRPLPASVYFKLQIEPTAVAPSMMVVRIWPQATFGTCKNVKIRDLPGTRQFHEIAMLPNKDPDHPAFVARIPPLQVGQRFCVSIQSFVPLTGDLLTALANEVANGAIPYLAPSSERIAQALGNQATRPAGNGAAPPAEVSEQPAPPLDAQREAIENQLKVRFKNRYGTDLHDAKSAAGKAAELVNQDLVKAYVRAVVLRQAAVTRNPAAAAAAANADFPEDSALRTATDNLKKSIVSALTNEAVKSTFSYDQIQSGSSLSGDGDTASAANYAAIDTGVVAAFPLGYAGGNGTPWALPYVGLNLYFTPVDRTVPLSQLVGQAGQRISLTVGRTLSSPTLPNRTISDFGFGYPVFAGGYRVSQFVRATVGAVFYKINVENPTSSNTVFGVAPFIGMALDGDVIAIAQGKLFAPN